MGNKNIKEGLKVTRSEIVTGNGGLPEEHSKDKSDDIIEKFNSLIKKKKEKYYSSNLKPHDFKEMCQQVQVVLSLG